MPLALAIYDISLKDDRGKLAYLPSYYGLQHMQCGDFKGELKSTGPRRSR